tara:strand:- start:362 stop:553 length:192 start_codon:yes stop_codon:yes gene_type:complete
MANKQKENKEQVFLRESSDERTALYELMRKRYPKGDKEKQLEFSLEIADERISDYASMFTANK